MSLCLLRGSAFYPLVVAPTETLVELRLLVVCRTIGDVLDPPEYGIMGILYFEHTLAICDTSSVLFG